jgi:ATP-binding cassette subfamily F protein 2
MASSWHQKKAKAEELQFEKDLAAQGNNFSENLIKKDLTEAAMGGGDEELFEKKLNKDEKKARAKAQREAKKKAKMAAKGIVVEEEEEDVKEEKDVLQVMMSKNAGEDGIDYDQADKLAGEGTICTFASSRKGVDARSRDINVQNFTLQHKGSVLLDETEIVLNHGNRYGLIGRNGCGKVRFVRFVLFCW